jgi:hypothetical protein
MVDIFVKHKTHTKCGDEDKTTSKITLEARLSNSKDKFNHQRYRNNYRIPAPTTQPEQIPTKDQSIINYSADPPFSICFNSTSGAL